MNLKKLRIFTHIVIPIILSVTDYVVGQSLIETLLLICLIAFGIFVAASVRDVSIQISIVLIKLQKRKWFHFASLHWNEKVDDSCCFLGSISKHILLLVIVMGTITYFASISIITFPLRLEEFFSVDPTVEIYPQSPMFYVGIAAPILFFIFYPVTLIFLTGVRTLIKESKLVNPAARPYMILISAIGIPWAIIWGILQPNFFSNFSATILSFPLLYGIIAHILQDSEKLVISLRERLTSDGFHEKDFNFLF